MAGDEKFKGAVLPVYFVADESGSMSGVIGDLNAGLVSLLERFHQDPMLAPKIRFGVVGFADNAVCHLEITNLLNVQRMPTLSVRGGTSFIAAFTDLRARIEADVTRLKAEGLGVHRPAVFMAITEFARTLTQSLVASALAIAAGQSEIVVMTPEGLLPRSREPLGSPPLAHEHAWLWRQG
jgi:uncharacterized protein YegL